MPRSIWNGTISFGLAHVPVKLYTATESKTVHFHEVHLSDGAPIEHRRICSKEGKEVPYKDVVKGFEVDEDEWRLRGEVVDAPLVALFDAIGIKDDHEPGYAGEWEATR